MDSEQIRRFGGGAALAMGALYVLVIPTSALVFLSAPDMANPASPSDPAALFPIMARAPVGFVIVGLEFGAATLLGFAVVPALAGVVGPFSPGWVRWAGTIAYLGFAVTAVSSFHSAAILPEVAANYVAGDAAVKTAIAAQYTPLAATQIDGWGLLQFGGVGFWALVVGLVALRSRAMPSDAAYLGIGLGAVWLLQTFGETIRFQLLIGLTGLLGTLLAVAWFLRIGLVLRRQTEVAAPPALSGPPEKG